MPRRYEVTFENATVAAASDLVSVTGGSGKMLQIIRAWWGPTGNTLATAQNLATRCRVLPATVSAGSGGSSATPRPLDGGDAAATFTARTNDTSKATTNGTARIVDENGRHVYNGYEWQPEEGPYVGPTDAFVFELIDASLQGTVKLSGGVEVEEMG